MSRVRRFVLVALLVIGAGVAVTACQSAPGLAAQVGDVRLTDAQVEQIVGRIDADLLAADETRLASQSAQPLRPGESGPTAQGLPAEVYGNVRQRIVEFTVFNELARRYAAERNLVLPVQDYAAAAAQIGIPEQNPYVHLVVDANAYQQLLQANAQQATPTENDLREVYRRAVAAGVVPDSTPFEQIRSQLEGVEQIKTGVWLRDQLGALAERVGVLVSPRYRPLEIPTAALQNQSGNLVLIALSLGETAGSPAVRDAG